MNEKLKRCPFCENRSPTLGTLTYRNGYMTATVYCENCGVETGGYSSEEEAISAWNRRAEN